LLVSVRRWATKTFAACAAIMFGLALSTTATPASARPMRVVSLNLCSDQLLMALAEREQIASLSFFASDPRFSLITDQIGDIPMNHGLAEEVLALRPDLVLTGTFTASYAVNHIKAQNIPVVTLAPAHSFDDITDRIMTVGMAIGQQDKAQALIDDMGASLADVENTPQPEPLRVVSFASGGATIGAPSLFDAVIRRAGLINLPSELGMGSWGQIGLDGIITLKPDLVLLEGIHQEHNSLTKQLMQHRALRKLRERGDIKLAEVDGRLWSCGGPHTVQAVAAFRKLGQQK